MKSKQAMPTMIALAAIVAVALSPLALAEEEVSIDAVRVAVDTPERPQVYFKGGTDGWEGNLLL